MVSSPRASTLPRFIGSAPGRSSCLATSIGGKPAKSTASASTPAWSPSRANVRPEGPKCPLELSMKRSEHRILLSHAGSLHRPDDLRDQMAARMDGEPFDEALAARVKEAVGWVVKEQVANGVD